MAGSKARPIVVIKKKGGHGGHHGGAWKVAYADFVTAMMSLFIVLWLMGSSEKVKKAVAGYFNDPKGTASLLGTTMTGTGETITKAANDNLQKLKEKLEKEIKARKDLEKLLKQIEITITPEGLRIELLEDKNGTFYQSGSAYLSPSGQELLALLASELKTLPNKLLIEGHTDATQYSNDANYSNWELSADRANSARRLLQQDGVRSNQVTQVRGFADQLPRVKDNPTDPSNRRVTILVKNLEGLPADLKGGRAEDAAQPDPSGGADGPGTTQPQPETPPSQSSAKSAVPSPVPAPAPGAAGPGIGSNAKPAAGASKLLAKFKSLVGKK
jgi:chemotaxis protein MotB